MPPYGDAPILFAPYGEYAEAFLLTADVRVEGRSGIAGAEDDVEEEGRGFDSVEDPVEVARAGY